MLELTPAYTPAPWPVKVCPRCRAAIGAEPQLDGHWTLVCVNGCGAEWADWDGTAGHKWQPTAAMRQVLAARGLTLASPPAALGAGSPADPQAPAREAA